MDIKRSHDAILLRKMLILGTVLLLLVGIPALLKQPVSDNPATPSLNQPVNAELPTPKSLAIEVSRDHYQKLKAKRDEAIGKGDRKGAGILITSDDDLVPATIGYNGQRSGSMIRLKGDWTQHLLGDTWSFRVKLNTGEAVEGMRKFSLQHPQTRNYAGEWLFHQLLKNDDILHLRYQFVLVTLVIVDDLDTEEKQLGLYALEEFFDKPLIEHNQRREGIILKIDEDPLWRERRAFMAHQVKLADLKQLSQTTIHNLDIVPFGRKRVLLDTTLYGQFNTAKYLFESFIDQKLSVSQVFDVEKLASFNAICNILGADHALYHHNYRVYYNPVNSRLEPIGFDADPIMQSFYFLHYLHAFEDPVFSEAYMKALERVVEDDYFEQLKQWPGLAGVIQLLQQYYPDYVFHQENLDFNRNAIKTFLYPVKALNIFFEALDGHTLTLTISNFNRFPAEILGLSTADKRAIGNPAQRIILQPNETRRVNFELAGNYNRLFVRKKKHKAGFRLMEDLQLVKVDFKTPGTSLQQQADILEWPRGNEHIAKMDFFRQQPNVGRFDFILTDTLDNTITVKKGQWQLKGPLHVPPGYTFRIPAGTTIEFMTGHTKIVSFSPVEILGTKEAPVRFLSNTNAGKGLLVLDARDTSIVRHCIFDNLSAPATAGWAATGAVTFYRSPVKLYNCAFTNNRSEDALNVINGYVEMDHIIFQNTMADAFDGDFVEGIVRNSIFDRLGNDAIDVSGSNITLANVQITQAGDKALSAGENSVINASNLTIGHSEIAVACKDFSHMALDQSTFHDNRLAFTAYQKKPEYGPAKIQATGINLTNNGEKHLIETGSTLTLNGERAAVSRNVVGRMYGMEYGKGSD